METSFSHNSVFKIKKYQFNIGLKKKFKLVLKIIVYDYGFNLKLKIVITNYVFFIKTP